MGNPLRDFFDFSSKEQRGLLSLVGIILVCLVVINFHHVIIPLDRPDPTEKYDRLSQALEQQDEVQDSQSIRPSTRSDKSTKRTEPFSFDPNTLDKEGYVILGFSEKQAQSILNYRNKGGVFRRTEDFKKLYVVDDWMYERLSPYVKIEKTESKSFVTREKEVIKEEKQQDKITEVEPKKKEVLSLNAATYEQLVDLPGIGPIYASRILKYKDLLGGYTSHDQLNEVYGLDKNPEIVEKLLPLLKINASATQKINVNTAEWKDLVRHPYISKSVANSIIAMRETHGPYKSIDDLQKSALIDKKLLDRLSPYIEL